MNDQETFDGQPADDEEQHWLSRHGLLTGSSAALATTGLATIGGAVLCDAAAAPPRQATPETMETAEAIGTPEAAAEDAAVHAVMAEGPSGEAFFTQLRNDTIEGMFSDPMYGGNHDLAGWKLIGFPGAQRCYTAGMLKSGTDRQPQSLAQLLVNEGHQENSDGTVSQG